MPLNPITGDANFNNLFGTDLADLIKGLGGNDAINGSLGDDRLYGGSGNDYVFGNEDDDRVYGGSGNDVVSGGDGDDLSYGGGGDDDIIAVAGNDTMYGGTGNDDIFGGFTSSGGTQLMFGGGGDDLLRFNIGQSGVADGGAGTDTVSVYWYDTAAYTTAVAITLSGPLPGAISGGNVIAFSGIERLLATTIGGDDTVVGGDLGDEIHVHLGANTVQGLGGDDLIGYLASQVNIIDAGDGNDTIRIASAHQGPTLLVVNGASATDGFGSTLLNAENFEVGGGFLNDVALFGAGNDLFDGKRGDDRADGNDGSDTLLGGNGDDLLSGGTGDDKIKGGDDNDALHGGDGNDTLDGGAGTDLLTGGLGADDFRLTRTDTSQTFVADFTGGTDRLLVGVGKTGAVIGINGQLDPALFNLGAAVGSFAQFVFIDDVGPLSRLVYDVNGDVAGGEQIFCQFTGPVSLTAADIFMV